MAGNNGVAHQALVPGCRHRDHATRSSIIQGLHQLPRASRGRLGKDGTQVQHACACVNTIDDGIGKIFRSGARHVASDQICFRIDRPYQQSAGEPGQIARAAEPRRAHKIPATNVPCRQAALSARAQVPRSFPGISLRFWPARSGWLRNTGPSIKPTEISGRPIVLSVSGLSRTTSRGPMACVFTDPPAGQLTHTTDHYRSSVWQPPCCLGDKKMLRRGPRRIK